jgi:hypothetical protein
MTQNYISRAVHPVRDGLQDYRVFSSDQNSMP